MISAQNARQIIWHRLKNWFSIVLEHGLIFTGDLLPYAIVFLMTLMIGYGRGLDAAAFFSVAYVYVAIVTSLVCGPNLLSIRRRMPGAPSPGAVVAAALGLRTVAIIVGALLVIVALYAANAKSGMLSLVAILFLGRFFETAVDAPATSIQYLRGARAYFTLRLIVFLIIFGFTGGAVFINIEEGIHWIASSYLIGSAIGFLYSLKCAYRLLDPIVALHTEAKTQISEFYKFFLATALFLAATRLHPVIISYFYDAKAAGQFAMVQNLFSTLAVASTGIAGVFFWSRNRSLTDKNRQGVPWHWLSGAIGGGLAMGAIGGVLLDFFFLQPLGSSSELRIVSWLMCLSTPLLLVQTILSHQLVILNRDREMLGLSVLNASAGLCIVAILVFEYGLIGGALAMTVAAFFSSLISIFVVKQINE